jgi:hypothetical protein
MIAVGAGDAIAARRYANEAERYLGPGAAGAPLKAQAAQVSGNRAAAETAFSRMMDDPETRVLGLRGLFMEARRRGDNTGRPAIRARSRARGARRHLGERRGDRGALRGRDWRGALAALERRASLGLVDKAALRRQRAVLLTADALDRVERDPHGALATAQDAVKNAPDLVPAAALAGRLLSHRGDLRKAARLVEGGLEGQSPIPTWRMSISTCVRATPPTTGSGAPRPSRSCRAGIRSPHRARPHAFEAREFGRARTTLEPLLAERPTVRVCLLMAELEQAEHGSSGRSREWIARARPRAARPGLDRRRRGVGPLGAGLARERTSRRLRVAGPARHARGARTRRLRRGGGRVRRGGPRASGRARRAASGRGPRAGGARGDRRTGAPRRTPGDPCTGAGRGRHGPGVLARAVRRAGAAPGTKPAGPVQPEPPRPAPRRRVSSSARRSSPCRPRRTRTAAERRRRRGAGGLFPWSTRRTTRAPTRSRRNRPAAACSGRAPRAGRVPSCRDGTAPRGARSPCQVQAQRVRRPPSVRWSLRRPDRPASGWRTAAPPPPSGARRVDGAGEKRVRALSGREPQ